MSYQERESKAVDAIKSAIPSSLKQDMIPESKGLFAELYQNDEVFPKHFAATAIDGVGTKLILAEAMGIYDTIGQDLVAMSANDLATLGKVSPFLFMDYIACQKKVQEEKLTGDIVKGISAGLQQCDASSIFKNSIRMNFGKGETASVDELMSSTRPGYGFDVAGAMIGFIEKDALKLEVNEGDAILALPSSGPHSNGYTDLRHNLLSGDFEEREEYKKTYKGKHSLDTDFEGTTVGKALLEPTRIYVKEMATLSAQFPVVGINNTGYGLKNLNRLPGNFKFVIDNAPEVQPIFGLMQQDSGFSDEQMYSTFNMGMGMFVMVPGDKVDESLQLVKDAIVVGKVEASDKKATVLKKDGSEIVFEGY